MDAALLKPHFQDADKAREYLESRRWPDGPVCPHCGIIGEATRLAVEEGTKTHARKGLLNCRACCKQFSVTIGTVFEDSHIPLNKWLLAFHLLCASKKGMSAHQLHRMLGITYRTAWFMAHRVRYAMEQEPLSSKLTGTVEIDEVYIGGKMRTGTHAVKPGERRRERVRCPAFPGRGNAQAETAICHSGNSVPSSTAQGTATSLYSIRCQTKRIQNH